MSLLGNVTAADVLAPTDSSGNPRSPSVSDVQNWGLLVERALDAMALSGGGLAFNLKVNLDASLGYPAQTMAFVLADTTANNGIYIKSGASGAGSWTKFAGLPGSTEVAAETTARIAADNNLITLINNEAASRATGDTNTETLAARRTDDQTMPAVAPGFANGGASYQNAVSGSGLTGGAPSSTIEYPVVDGFPIARFADLTGATVIVLAQRDVFTLKKNTTYRLRVRARLTGATSLGTNQAILYLTRMNSSYGSPTNTQALISLTASYQWFTLEYTTDTAPVTYLRASFAKMNTYTDATGKIEVSDFIHEEVVPSGYRLENRVAAIEKAGNLSRINEIISTVLNPGFVAGASAYQSSIAGSPAIGAALSSTIQFPVVSGAAIARFTDLTSATAIFMGVRETITLKPNTTYRLILEARLTGATSLGANQASIQFNALNSSYISAEVVSKNISLTADYQRFELDYTTGSSPANPYLRASFIKAAAYTDATGVFEVRLFKVLDLTSTDLGNSTTASAGSGGAAPAPLAMAQSAGMLGVRIGSTGRKTVVNNFAGWYAVQPDQHGVTYAHGGAAATAPKFDLSYLIDDSEIAILVNAGSVAKFLAGQSRNFAGQSGNQLTVTTTTAAALVTIKCINGSVFAVVTGGSAVYSSAPVIMAKSILCAGQSQAVLFPTHGGIGGFVEASRDATWMVDGIIDPEAYWVQGATGGTAILKASLPGGATNYWYDDDLDANGPALTTCLAAIDAAVAAGQPAPGVVIWHQGEAESFALEDGSMTKSRFTAGIKDVWGIIRSHLISKGAADPQFIVSAVGSHDLSTYRKGISYARQAYLQAIDDVAWAHFGAQTYDVPRAWGDIHYTATGYHLWGKRLARAYANIMLGGGYDLGPVVSGIAISGDRLRLTLTLSSAESTLAMPVGTAAPGVSLGGDLTKVRGAPCGFCVLSSTGAPLTIKQAEIGASTIALVMAAPIPAGATVHFPAGYFPEARNWDFATDNQIDATLHWPGLPLRDYGASVP